MATQIQTQFIADSAVTVDKIGALAVSGAKIQDGAVGTAKIADGAVGATKLGANAVEAAAMSSAAKTAVLQSKLQGRWLWSAVITSPAASFMEAPAALGFGSAAGVDPVGAAKGIACLLEGAGAGQEFNTTAGKVGLSGAAQHYSAMVPVTDVNNNSIVDAAGKEVWAVLTASSRVATAANYKLRFFSGPFKSGTEVAYSMGQDFKFAYPRIYDLSDLGIWDEWGTALVDAEAAQLAAGQITLSHLAANSVDASKIVDGSVGTAELADGGVTSGKLAAGSVGSAALAANAVGSAAIADNAVGSTELATDAVIEGKIQAGAVTVNKIGAGAVTSAKIADGAVLTAALGDGQVTSGKLAANSVLSAAIADNAVTSTELATDAVVELKIAANAVTTGKIAAAAVDSSKLASAVKDRVGGGWDVVVKFDGPITNCDLSHADAENAEEALFVTVGGLVMEHGVDYTFSNDGGAGGVDRIVLSPAAPSAAKVIVRYRRTSL